MSGSLTGLTTRQSIRTFIVWSTRHKVSPALAVGRRKVRSSPLLTLEPVRVAYVPVQIEQRRMELRRL